MRPCAHHHQLVSHNCNLRPNPQNPLQCSKLMSISSCSRSSDSWKTCLCRPGFCVRTGTPCTKIMQQQHCAGSYACQDFSASHILLAKRYSPQHMYELNCDIAPSTKVVVVALLQSHVRADLHVQTLKTNPNYSFMGQTCMSPAGGQVYVVTSYADQGVVCNVVAYFGTQLTVLQACQLSHLWTPANVSNHQAVGPFKHVINRQSRQAIGLKIWPSVSQMCVKQETKSQ